MAEVITYKYIVELSVYPNGKCFHKMYPISKNAKNTKPKKEPKVLGEVEVGEEVLL